MRALAEMPQARYAAFDPAIRPERKLAQGLELVTTPYAVLWADDDLMVPSALAEAVAWLERHPDDSVAHGRAGLYQVEADAGRMALRDWHPYPQRAYRGATAAERLRDYLRHYTMIVYSVQRAAPLRDHLRRACAYLEGRLAPGEPVHRNDLWVELLLGCLPVLHGKAHCLDRLGLLRDSHPGWNSWEGQAGNLSNFDWITSSSFSPAYAAFSSCVSEALARRDGISRADAEAVVKDAFWGWLGPALETRWQAQYARRPEGAARRLARSAPAAAAIWRSLRQQSPSAALRRDVADAGAFHLIQDALTTPYPGPAARPRAETALEPVEAQQ